MSSLTWHQFAFQLPEPLTRGLWHDVHPTGARTICHWTSGMWRRWCLCMETVVAFVRLYVVAVSHQHGWHCDKDPIWEGARYDNQLGDLTLFGSAGTGENIRFYFFLWAQQWYRQNRVGENTFEYNLLGLLLSSAVMKPSISRSLVGFLLDYVRSVHEDVWWISSLVKNTNIHVEIELIGKNLKINKNIG